jgi:hypothetical protein
MRERWDYGLSQVLGGDGRMWPNVVVLLGGICTFLALYYLVWWAWLALVVAYGAVVAALIFSAARR